MNLHLKGSHIFFLKSSDTLRMYQIYNKYSVFQYLYLLALNIKQYVMDSYYMYYAQIILRMSYLPFIHSLIPDFTLCFFTFNFL